MAVVKKPNRNTAEVAHVYTHTLQSDTQKNLNTQHTIVPNTTQTQQQSAAHNHRPPRTETNNKEKTQQTHSKFVGVAQLRGTARLV